MWLWVGRLWSAEERTAAELRTDPLAVLMLRLIDTAGLVGMHYGSVVAVYCLALRGVGSRCVSQPVRHLKDEKKTSPSAVLQDSAMVTEASNLRLHVQPRWLRCISIPASSLSALQNLVLPLPPSLPGQEAEPSLRLMCWCLRQIGTVVPSVEVLMLCLCVWMTVCVFTVGAVD